jgi:KRAB domain-containing zinc finger protein
MTPKMKPKSEIHQQNISKFLILNIKLETSEPSLVKTDSLLPIKSEPNDAIIKIDPERDLLSVYLLQPSKKIKTEENDQFPRKFICDRDGKTFDTKSKLRHHVYGSHVYKICEFCHKLVNCTHIVAHIRQAHNTQRPHHCEICKKAFKSKRTLKNHCQNVHFKKHTCEICEKKFKSRSQLNDHKLRHHGSGQVQRFKCSFCSIIKLSQKTLNMHVKSMHADGKVKEFVCDYDGKVLLNKQLLYQHMLSHKSTMTCHICQKIIKVRSKYDHMKLHTIKEKQINCQLCPKMFRTEENLKSHMRNHDRRFGCETCGKTFGFEHNLKTHMVVHADIRPFECSVCKSTFKLKSSLKNHLKTHDLDKKKSFSCQKCEFSTDIRITMTRHINSHEKTEEKYRKMVNALECNQCDVKCRNKKALQRHKQAVHPALFFQCNFCGNNFKIKSHVQRHLGTCKARKELMK